MKQGQILWGRDKSRGQGSLLELIPEEEEEEALDSKQKMGRGEGMSGSTELAQMK